MPDSKFPPEILAALERAEGKTEMVSFAKGFKAGQQFQYEQIERILCKMCSNNIPKVDLSGTMVHEVQSENGMVRRTCEARLIHSFRI